MTKDVSIPGNAASADALSLPPGPSPAKSPKPEREFSSVIDQATGRKAAHTRTTRSSARGRGSETESATGRERVTRTARGESSNRPVSRATKSPSKNIPADDYENRPEARGVAAESKNKAEAEETAETPATDESAEPLTGSSEENASNTGTPGNIVPFPGQTVPAGVIVPFPLAEAQSIPAAGASAVAASSANEAVRGQVGTEEPVSTSPGSVVVPIPTSRSVTTDRTPVEGDRSDDDFDGIDVERLGLRRVTSNETLDAAKAEVTAAKSRSGEVPTQGDLDSKIVSVAFRTSAETPSHAPKVQVSGEGQTQLPGDPARRVESAPRGALTESSAKIVLLRTDAGKAASGGASGASVGANAGPVEITGTSVAKQDVRMESTTTSERETETAEQTEEVMVRLPELAAAPEGDGAPATHPARGLAENDWESARLLNQVSRSESADTEVKGTDSTGAVERISNLIARESALVRKHGSDSMAVVLRPDAETELFVHLTQSNGRIEATIRCERGDAHQLGALWSQLQESLAQQKIRLAPLQETSGGNSNFNQSSGGSMTSGGQNGAREEARPEKQSMDDWPASAVPATPAPHVRGTGDSRRRRITTSRPGWETWA